MKRQNSTAWRVFGATLALFSASAYWALSTNALSLSGGVCVVCPATPGPSTIVSTAPLMGDGSIAGPLTINPGEPITTSSLTATNSMLVRTDAFSVGPTGLIGMGTTNPAFGVHISSRLVLLDGAGNNLFLNQGSIGIQLDGAVTGSLTVRRSDSSSPSTNADIFLVRRRGTQAAPAAVTTGDFIGGISFRGYGTGEATGAVIRGLATGLWSGTNRESRINFLTVPTGSTVLTQAMTISQKQFAGFGTIEPAYRVHVSSSGVYADGTNSFLGTTGSVYAASGVETSSVAVNNSGGNAKVVVNSTDGTDTELSLGTLGAVRGILRYNPGSDIVILRHDLNPDTGIVLDAVGNVGINNAAPTAALDVDGNIVGNSSVTASAVFSEEAVFSSSMTASYINVAGASNVASIVAVASSAANVAINTTTGIHFSTATATLRGGRYFELSSTVVIDNQAGAARVYTFQFFEDGAALGPGINQTVLAGDDYLGTATLPFNAGRTSGSHSYSVRVISNNATGTQLLANGNIILREF